MTDEDWQQLKRFLDTGAEGEFEPLVRRHMNLVYSAALKMLPAHRDHVDDVTQTVFADLVKKARSISPQMSIAGWLYRHTYFVSSDLKRAERRHRQREQQAVEMNAIDSSGSEPPVPSEDLHHAMNELSESDRDALVLRFLKERDLKSVGEALGITEDTAQKRVSRALEKLRAILERRGIRASIAGLTACLAQQIQAAPASLIPKAVAIASVGLAAKAGFFGAAMTTLKTPLFKAAATLVVGAGLVATVIHQNGSLDSLRRENSGLKKSATEMPDLRSENEQLAKLKANSEELERLRKEMDEVYRLRGKVTLLQNEVARLNSRPLPAISTNAPVETNQVVQIQIVSKVIKIHRRALTKNAKPLNSLIARALTSNNGSVVFSTNDSTIFMQALMETDGVDILAAPRVVTMDGQQGRVSVTKAKTVIVGYQRAGSGRDLTPVTTNFHCGPILNLTPYWIGATGSVRMNVKATILEFLGYTETDDVENTMPIFNNFEASSSVILQSGQTVVLSGPTSSGEDVILVLITPARINATGNSEAAPGL